MNTPTKVKISIIAGLLGLVSTGSVLAHCDGFDANYGSSKPSTTNAISLKQAAIIAQENTGGEPIEVEREFEKGQIFYQVTIVNVEGKEFETVINAASGSVVSTQEETGIDTDDLLENVAWASDIQDGKMKSLVSAVNAAEAKYKAKAYDVELEDFHRFNKQGLGYEIKLVDASGSKIKTHVSAK